MYVYSEINEGGGCYLYVVGYYTPQGDWEPESDHSTREDAAARVHYLNGGDDAIN